MVRRRGDDIPPISAYAHWNEDAERVWYEENRYDMEHADEIIEDDAFDDRREHEPEPYEDEFPTKAEAEAFGASLADSPKSITEWKGEWIVEHYDDAGHKRWLALP